MSLRLAGACDVTAVIAVCNFLIKQLPKIIVACGVHVYRFCCLFSNIKFPCSLQMFWNISQCYRVLLVPYKMGINHLIVLATYMFVMTVLTSLSVCYIRHSTKSFI